MTLSRTLPMGSPDQKIFPAQNNNLPSRKKTLLKAMMTVTLSAGSLGALSTGTAALRGNLRGTVNHHNQSRILLSRLSTCSNDIECLNALKDAKQNRSLQLLNSLGDYNEIGFFITSGISDYFDKAFEDLTVEQIAEQEGITLEQAQNLFNKKQDIKNGYKTLADTLGRGVSEAVKNNIQNITDQIGISLTKDGDNSVIGKSAEQVTSVLLQVLKDNPEQIKSITNSLVTSIFATTQSELPNITDENSRILISALLEELQRKGNEENLKNTSESIGEGAANGILRGFSVAEVSAISTSIITLFATIVAIPLATLVLLALTQFRRNNEPNSSAIGNIAYIVADCATRGIQNALNRESFYEIVENAAEAVMKGLAKGAGNIVSNNPSESVTQAAKSFTTGLVDGMVEVTNSQNREVFLARTQAFTEHTARTMGEGVGKAGGLDVGKGIIQAIPSLPREFWNRVFGRDPNSQDNQN